MTVERIGRYRIEAKLGEGSFASVWLGIDSELDDRVAIKVLAPRWAERPEVHDRFVREARLLRRLAGDRIVQIHDIDQMPDGQPYFVMEYADRGSLADRLSARDEGEPFQIQRAVAIAKGIAKGLQVAHRAGVIHRDLKPANVLFRTVATHDIPTTLARRDTPFERLVLADFGLARALGTVSGQTANVGTPYYAAPEQFEGRADARSDLYALAVVLFEMLAGERPFGRGASPDRSDVPAVRDFNPDVPPDLADLVTTGLATDPDDRLADASAWVEALRGLSNVAAFTPDPITPRAVPPDKAPEPATTLAQPPGAVTPAPSRHPGSGAPSPVAGAQPGRAGDVTPALIATSTWSDADVEGAGIPIVDVPFVTVGGGLGSFVLVDLLRIAGVSTEQIVVLTPTRTPWETYAYLARTSQIPDHERIRSDSGSTPDNIWGFPSYAVREALSARSLGDFLAPLWNVLTEPILADYYTPRASQVYESLAREADRVRFGEMTRLGLVRTVRRRLEGGYFVVHTPEAGKASTRRIAYRSPFVHLALGYPGVRFLPDLQQYRENHQDYSRVVAAYEPHDHVYRTLNSRPGVVMVRGSGIVASRILQRLIDDRDARGAQTKIWHVFRNFVSGPEGPVLSRRPGANGFAYQGFNFAKSAWGGQHRSQLLKLPREERPAFIKTIGGTNTAPRKSWKRQLEQGRREGFYQTWAGEVDDVQVGTDGVVVKLSGKGTAQLELTVDFIIDATGLEADIRTNRVLDDLMTHTDTRANPLGRLDVSPSFSIIGADSPPGRIYASGSSTLGGYYAPVDSFLGLQYAALQIADDLARQGFGERIGLARSISQWLKWVRGQAI